MKKLKNNKGVAFVTVLISITFITILAVSLLYMAYLNYLTKAARTRSNDNFYTGEFGVDEVAAKLQQTAAEASNINDAKGKIKSAVGGSVDSGTGTYKPELVTNLINVANSDGSSIVVSSVNPEYVVNSNSVKLKNLRFDTTDASGYISTIYTDMTIQFQSTPPGDFDINDFSIISDSFYTADSDAGQGSSAFAGCIYLKKESGKSYALLNDKKTLVSILSPVGIIDGDLIIKSKPSAVSIAGDVMVRGKIEVEDGCSLVVSGTLKVSEKKENCKLDGRIVGNIQYGVNMDALPEEGLTGALFAKHVYMFNSDEAGGKSKMTDLATLPNSISDERCFYTEKVGGTEKKFIYPVAYISRTDDGRSTAITDVSCEYKSANHYKAKLNLPVGTMNGDDDGCSGCFAIGTKDITCKNEFRETTFMTLGRVKQGDNQSVSLSKMSDDGFKAAKESMFIWGSGDTGYKNSDMKCEQGKQICGKSSYYYQGGTFEDFCDAMCSGEWVVYSYNVDSGEMSNTPLIGAGASEDDKKKMKELVYKKDAEGQILDGTDGKAKEIAISTDDDTRYLVFKAGSGKNKNEYNSDFDTKNSESRKGAQITMMIPYGYFLGANTSGTISKYVSSTSTAEDPSMTTIRYDNWYKE